MNYETNRKWLLIFSALLIAYVWLDISFDLTVPYINIRLNKEQNIKIILISLIVFFSILTLHSWFLKHRQNRSIFDISVCFFLVLLSITSTVLDFVQSYIHFCIALLWGIYLSIVGHFYGITIHFIITSFFCLRTNNEMEQLGLGRIPTATKAVIRFLKVVIIPIDIILTTIIILIFIFYPNIFFPYWWIILVVSFLIINFDPIFNLILCIGPKPIRRKGLENLKMLRGPMDLHEMHYQHIGLEKPKSYEVPYICKIAKIGQETKLEQLLNNGENPDKQDGRGWTPLMWASAENHLNAVKVLLSHGANPNLENYLGRTALMYASRYGYIDIVQELVANGAEINTYNELSTHPPLLAAAKHGHVSVVEFLIKSGADIFHKDKYGKNALAYAMESKHGEVAKIIRFAMHDYSYHNHDRNENSSNLSWIIKKLKNIK